MMTPPRSCVPISSAACHDARIVPRRSTVSSRSSFASVDRAAAALKGGPDVIDAKDPDKGSLGSVPAHVFRDIRNVVGDARPVTAALGDATDAIATERVARQSAEAGARFVKVGFAGVGNAT